MVSRKRLPNGSCWNSVRISCGKAAAISRNAFSILYEPNGFRSTNRTFMLTGDQAGWSAGVLSIFFAMKATIRIPTMAVMPTLNRLGMIVP